MHFQEINKVKGEKIGKRRVTISLISISIVSQLWFSLHPNTSLSKGSTINLSCILYELVLNSCLWLITAREGIPVKP